MRLSVTSLEEWRQQDGHDDCKEWGEQRSASTQRRVRIEVKGQTQAWSKSLNELSGKTKDSNFDKIYTLDSCVDEFMKVHLLSIQGCYWQSFKDPFRSNSGKVVIDSLSEAGMLSQLVNSFLTIAMTFLSSQIAVLQRKFTKILWLFLGSCAWT